MKYNKDNINFETLIVSILYNKIIDREKYRLRKEMFLNESNIAYVAYILKNKLTDVEELNQSFIAENLISIYSKEDVESIMEVYRIKTIFEIFYKKAIQLVWSKATQEKKDQKVDNLEDIKKSLDEFREILASLENQEDTRTPFEKYKEKLNKIKDDVEDGTATEGFWGIASGIGGYDVMIKGFKPGSYNIIAGRPSMGKTSLALDVVANNIKEGKNSVVFSLEMPAHEIVGRLIPKIDRSLTIGNSMHGEGVTNETILAKIMSAADYIEKSGLKIFDFSTQNTVSPADLALKCEEVKRKSGTIDLVVLDYIQLLSNTMNKDENAIITTYSGLIQRLAKTTEAPWLVLSQLNRDLERRNDKRPMLADLRGSGSLEQDADSITFVYRDAVYAEQEVKDKLAKNPGDKILKEQLNNLITTDVNTGEIIVGKNRNGPTGSTYDVVFHKPTATYSSESNSCENIDDLCKNF